MGVAGRSCGAGRVEGGASRTEGEHRGLSKGSVSLTDADPCRGEPGTPCFVLAPGRPRSPSAHLSGLLFSLYIHPLVPSARTVPSAWNIPPAPPWALPAHSLGLRANAYSERPSRTTLSQADAPPPLPDTVSAPYLTPCLLPSSHFFCLR